MVAGTPPSGSEPSEEDEEAEAELARQAEIAQKRKGARKSILGESHTTSAGWRPPVHAKTPEQKKQIEAALSRSFLFSSLSAEDLATVVAAFAGPHNFARGKEVIKEGAVVAPDEPGLYVVGSGAFDVFKRSEGTSGRGNKVFTYDSPGQSFGELALLYNCPRAATVVAQEDGVLWSIDRDTFNNCVKGAQIALRERHLRFLSSVEVLKDLEPSQLDKVVDVVKVRTCKVRDKIVRQGDEGTEFFILEEGRASAYIDATKVKDYGPGSYFGELALIKSQPRKADIIANSEVRLLVLDGDSFIRLLGPLSNSMLGGYKKKASFGLREVEPDYEVQDDWATDEPKELEEDDEEEEEAEAMPEDFDLSLEDSELMFGAQHTKKQTTGSKDAGWEPPTHPKTTRQREQIGRAVQESFMFSSLTEEKLQKVIDAFRGPLEYQKKATVIRQGDTVTEHEPGLFVLERGALDVYKTTEGGPMPGGRIFRYDKPGQSFGELALIYECPRGATVIAAENSVLWSIDRDTFNHLIKGSHIMMRSKIEEFLSSVDIMRELSKQDRERVADLVQLMEYKRGERVIRQGQPGNAMYMVKAGKLYASIDGHKVKLYGPGDYFGELSLLRSEPRNADVFVDHSGPAQLMALDGDSFRRLLGPVMETLQKRAEGYVAPAQSSRKVLRKPPPGWKPPVVQKSQEEEYQLTRAAEDSPLLSRLPQEAFDQVIRAFRGPHNLKKGYMVLRQGSVLKHERFLMLSRGIIDICKAPEGKSPPGQKLRQYDYAGQTFCEEELIYGEVSSISAVCSTADVVTWELDKETFMYLIAGAWMERQKHLENVLADIDILQALSFEDQKKLLAVLGDRMFHKGQYIVKNGEVGKEFYIVEQGSASARVDGHEVRTYGKSSYFGELALIRPNSLRNADVVASVTPTRLLVLDGGDFRKILGENAPVMQLLEQRAEEYNNPRALRSGWNSMLQAFPDAAAAAADVAFEPDGQSQLRPSTNSLRSMFSDDNKDGCDMVMEELAFSLRRGSKVKKTMETPADDALFSSDGSDEADDDDDLNGLAFSANLALARAKGRRWCVCGEKWNDAEEWLHHQTSKGLAQSQRIMNACMKLFMFSLMPSEDLKVLVGAFKGPLRACAGDLVIRQGQYTLADEPALYVVESGSLKAFHAAAGVPLPGEHIKTFVAGHAFGELALLHDSPRPITVVAKSDCQLWWIDRRGADHIVKESCSIMRARREAFLENVKLLASLTAHERSMIAESMYSRVYEQGDVIIKQGDQGDEFFMIEEGSAEASIGGVLVKTYTANDYFGELSLIRRQPRAADVSATFTPTRVAILNASSFRSLLGSLDILMAERAKVYVNVNNYTSDRPSVNNEGIRGRRRSSLFGNKASMASLQSLFSVEPGASDGKNEIKVGELSKWWNDKEQKEAAKKSLVKPFEDNSWTCMNPRCRFVNLGHVNRCMNCDNFHVMDSAQILGAGVGLYGGSGSSPTPRSGSSGSSPRKRLGAGGELAALPASPLAVAAAEAAQAPARPVASANLDVVNASSSFVARLGPADCLADDGAHIDFAGAYIMRFGVTTSRTTAGEAGIAQWPFPVAPGERFFARLLVKGTFGEVGLGLAPLRRGPGAAALPSSGASSIGGSAPGGMGHVAMVGWAPDEVGFHGNHGKCYTRGKAVQASYAWEVDDIVECGLTLRGQAYFCRNGERVFEADGFWPTAQAYPTLTLRSVGSEMLVSLKEVSEKSLLGLGSNSAGGGFGSRNAWDLLTAFRRTVVEDNKRAGAAGKPGLSVLDRWFGSCGVVAPTCGSCTQIEAASK